MGLMGVRHADHWVGNYDQKATRLIACCDPEVGGTMTLRRRERLSKLETRVMRSVA